MKSKCQESEPTFKTTCLVYRRIIRPVCHRTHPLQVGWGFRVFCLLCVAFTNNTSASKQWMYCMQIYIYTLFYNDNKERWTILICFREIGNEENARSLTVFVLFSLSNRGRTLWFLQLALRSLSLSLVFFCQRGFACFSL